MHFGALKTEHGYVMDQVASAFQKCLRRGLEEDALYWARELDASGYGGYAFSRLLIVVSEDLGVATPHGFTADIYALYQMWEILKKKKSESAPIHLIHAIQRVCRVPKSRKADTAFVVVWNDKLPRKEIPDFALGMHTAKGRSMGRGIADFYENGAVIEPDAGIEDIFYDRAVGIDTEMEKPRKNDVSVEAPKQEKPATQQASLFDGDDVPF